MKKVIIICDMSIIPDIPDMPDIPDISEEADDVAEDVAMPLISMEVEEAIAIVLVAMFMLSLLISRVEDVRWVDSARRTSRYTDFGFLDSC